MFYPDRSETQKVKERTLNSCRKESLEYMRYLLYQMECQYRAAENLELVSIDTLKEWEKEISLFKETLAKLQE